MRPRQLLTVRPIGDADLPYWTAASDDGRTVILEAGEAVLWRGVAQIREKSPQTWTLENVTLLVTDRRLVFLTTSFDKGGGWVGFGVGGLVTAAAANAVSKARANKRRAGKVAIGHIRHEWVQSLWVNRRRVLIGGPEIKVYLAVTADGKPRIAELYGGATRDEFAIWLARVVAGHRLSLDPHLSPTEHETLTRYSGGGSDRSPDSGETAPGWTFPGDPDALIATAQGTLRGSPQASTGTEPADPRVMSAPGRARVGARQPSDPAGPPTPDPADPPTPGRGAGARCTGCGSELATDQQFCHACGRPAGRSTIAPDERSAAGTRSPDPAKPPVPTTPVPTTPVPTTPVPTTPVPTTPALSVPLPATGSGSSAGASGLSRPWVIGVGVAILLLGAGAFWVARFGGTGSSDPSADSAPNGTYVAASAAAATRPIVPPPSATPVPTPTGVTNRVDVSALVNAATGGVPSGVVVSAGQLVTVDAVGQVTYGPASAPCAGYPTTGPAGNRWLSSMPCGPTYASDDAVPGFPVGTLIGRIGANNWYPIGAHLSFRSNVSGELFLAYNDGYSADNVGSYQVTVTTG